jgi:hypothetical protein
VDFYISYFSLSDMNGVISKTVLPNIFFSKTAHVHLKAAPEVLKKKLHS